MTAYRKFILLIVIGAVLDHIFDWSDAMCIIYLLGAIAYQLALIVEKLTIDNIAKEIRGEGHETETQV